jgi:large subunit ribosomal protein L18
MDKQRLLERQRQRRQGHVRRVIRQTADRPRLSVCRSGKHISCQVIDDTTRRTLAAASTLQKDIKAAVSATATVEAAKAVGKAIAERAKAAGVEAVVFDRGRLRYHGRVAALADAAREAGLQF